MDTNTPTSSTYIAPDSVAGTGLAAVGTVSASDPNVAPTSSTVPEFEAPRRRKLPLQAIIAGVFLLVLVIGGVAAYFLTQQEQDVASQASALCSFTESDPACKGIPKGNVGFCQPVGPELYTCQSVTDSCSCKGTGLDGSGKPLGDNESEDEDGDDSDDNENDCGGNGQSCCASGTICSANLFCNGAGVCQGSSDGLCSPDDSAGGIFGEKCALYDCGSQCNYGSECRLSSPTKDGNCEEMVSLLGSKCGQVDYLDQQGRYCGVKAIRCDGSCQGGGGGGGGVSVQCKEIVAKVQTATGNEIRPPKVGEQMFLKCKKVANGVKYKFRYFRTKKKGAKALQAITGKTPVSVKAESKGSNKSVLFTIDKPGFFYAQCSACVPDASSPNGRKCSRWEAAANGGIVLTGGTGASLAATSTVDDDDGLPPGIEIPYRSVFELDLSPSIERPIEVQQ